MNKQVLMIGFITLLSACASAPQKEQTRQGAAAPIVDLHGGGVASAGGGYLSGDGPGVDAPANLDAIPDALPKAEPLHRYANRPYSALGKRYTPLTEPGNYKERGIASWYGKKFHGQRTSIGEVYDMYGMSAAHPTLPIPSYARVTNPANGKSVVVRVNDRGPFLHDRIMDLSYAAAYRLGFINQGSAEVVVESLAADAGVPVVKAVEQPATIKVEAETSAPLPVEAAGARSGKVFLQLGAFKSRQGAESFLTRMRAILGDTDKRLKLHDQGKLTKVHLGPFVNADEARRAAMKLQVKLGFKPFVSQ